jgi:antitoxin component of RelBE/YafQ-DinJ toxin-antitoxin module
LQLNINKVLGNIYSQSLTHNSVLSHGQIVRGKVSKLFPNNMAQIQLLNQTVVAKLEIPLVMGDHYHFQVHVSNQVLYLKVIGERLKNQSKLDIPALLKNLGVKNSEVNRLFLQKLMADGVLFEKTQLVQALRLLETYKNNEQVQEVLKELIQRRFPLTDSIFQAIYSKNTESQSKLIGNLINGLHKQESFTDAYTMLRSFVNSGPMQSNNNIELEPKEFFLRYVHQYLSNSGLDYEYTVKQQNDFHKPSIKGYLLQMLSIDGEHQIHAEKLLHYLNGMQLNTINESNNFIQVNFNFPGEVLGLKNDLNLELTSKKSKEGTIDPDFCRIYFYLELEYLHETIIDMHIQQRNVTITVYNNVEDLKGATIPLQIQLKSGLEKLNYHLTNVLFKTIPSESSIANKLPNNDYKPSNFTGVDFRI